MSETATVGSYLPKDERYTNLSDHLIGSPKALACEKFAPKAWTRFADIPALKAPNMEFVRGSVTSVDPERKVAQILELQSQQTRHEQYDYLIAASGLRRVFPTVPQSLCRDDFLNEAKLHRKNVQDAQEGLVIVGGGAVGVEMATEVKELNPNQKITLIHSRDRLLSAEPLPDDFKDRVCDILRETGIEVILGQRVIDHKAVETNDERRTWHLTLADGTQLKAGHILSAISKCVPTSTYLPQDTLDQEGYVHIHPTYATLPLLPLTYSNENRCQFQNDIPNAEHHFAIGDLASWPGIKRCGGAMLHGHYAATNAHQLMLSECIGSKPELISLQVSPPMIGLCLGKTAVTYNNIEGTRSGEDLMASMFGDDMGNTSMYKFPPGIMIKSDI